MLALVISLISAGVIALEDHGAGASAAGKTTASVKNVIISSESSTLPATAAAKTSGTELNSAMINNTLASPPDPANGTITLTTLGFDIYQDQYYYCNQTLQLNQTALLIIDPWETFDQPDGTWEHTVESPNVIDYLNPLASALRDSGVQIIIASYGNLSYGLNSNLTIYPGDKVWTAQGEDTPSLEELENYLDERGITNVIFAGYATNFCMIKRPVSIYAVAETGRYNIILVRDCTVADDVPGAETYSDVIENVESYFAMTTTLADVRQALDYTPSLPVANFTASVTAGTDPLTVQFDDHSTGKNITRWEWNFGDGSANTTTEDPTHVYLAPGTYDVSLWVIGEDGSNGVTEMSCIRVT